MTGRKPPKKGKNLSKTSGAPAKQLVVDRTALSDKDSQKAVRSEKEASEKSDKYTNNNTMEMHRWNVIIIN